MLSFVLPIPLEKGEVAKVAAYDFVGAALALLQDCSIMKQENLCIDFNNPLKHCYPKDGMLGKALSSSAYTDNFEQFVGNSSCPQLAS